MGLFREIADAIDRNTRAIEKQTLSQHINAQLLLDQLVLLNRSLRRMAGITNPGPIRIINVQERADMPDTIQFAVQLPEWPAEPSDVAKGQLSVKIGESDPVVQDVEKGATEVAGLEGPQDATVVLSFIYIDDAGNASENPATASVVLTDTVPPPDPGALGVRLTGETNT